MLFEGVCFHVFPCRDIPRQSFRKRKKSTDTLVPLVTNYKQKQKHVIRGITCVAFDSVSFQKTECSQT